MLAVVDPENVPPVTTKKPLTVTNRVPLGDRSNWQVKPLTEEEPIIILETEDDSEVEVEVDWDEEGNPLMTSVVSKPTDEVEELKRALREALEENKMLWGRVKEQEREIERLQEQEREIK